MDSQEVKEIVKAEYGQAALHAKRGGSSCCGSVSERAAPITSNLYEVKETEALPAEAVLASTASTVDSAQPNPGGVVVLSG
jgi:hypothetical protein